MAAEGLKSLFPMEDLSIMGISEVLPKARLLLARIRQTARAARDLSPDVMVTIDAPGFSFRVGRRLSGRHFPLVHYVAPTVWISEEHPPELHSLMRISLAVFCFKNKKYVISI